MLNGISELKFRLFFLTKTVLELENIFSNLPIFFSSVLAIWVT